MALITPADITALQVTFSKIYQRAYEQYPAWGTKLATTVPSATLSNRYGFMGRTARMRQWVGPRILNNLLAHSYTLENLTFEYTESVDREDWEDQNLGVYEPRMAMMGLAAARWPDEQLAGMIQANPVGFDAVAFFNNAHPLNPAGVQSNIFPGTALTAANYETVRAAMYGFLGDNGVPLGVTPNLLVVPPQLEGVGRRILNAEIVATAAGTASETNIWRNSAELLVIPEFANAPTQWYLGDVSKPVKPFVWQLRRAPEFTNKTALTDDNVFFDRELIWGVDSRGRAGVSCWWLAARATA